MRTPANAAARLAEALAIVLGTPGHPAPAAGLGRLGGGPAGAPLIVFQLPAGVAPDPVVARAAGPQPGLRGRGNRCSRRRLCELRRTELGRQVRGARPVPPPTVARAGHHVSGPPSGSVHWGRTRRRRRKKQGGPRRPAPLEEARRCGHLAPLRRRQRLLRPCPWALDGLLLRCLGPTRTRGSEAAQEAKLDLVCRKLGLEPGMRVLDVGCGWGSFALHAARHYGVDVVGVTLSTEQAALAGKRAADAGLTDRVDIRVQDYRDVDDGPFDAISSIGMSEHVGREQMPTYAVPAAWPSASRRPAAQPRHLLERRTHRPGPGFVHPPLCLSRTARCSASPTRSVRWNPAGFEVLDVEALRRHYALTLRAWVQNLEEHWAEAVQAVGRGACPGVAALHGGERPGLRGRTDGRQPGPRAARRRRPNRPLRRTGWI